jgi:anti-sigma factor ChrR (cupin superfamily)
MPIEVSLPPPLVLHELFSEHALATRTWEPFRKGIEIHWIYRQPNAASAALLRYAPGASLERHDHAGFEHILVLRGSQSDDNGEYRRGSLLINAPGTSHAVHSAEGCVVLAIWEKAVHAVSGCCVDKITEPLIGEE